MVVVISVRPYLIVHRLELATSERDQSVYAVESRSPFTSYSWRAVSAARDALVRKWKSGLTSRIRASLGASFVLHALESVLSFMKTHIEGPIHEAYLINHP